MIPTDMPRLWTLDLATTVMKPIADAKRRRIMTGQSTADVFKQAMVNEMQAERSEHGDQESVRESMLSYGPVWLVLTLACGIGFLGSSAFLHNYGVASRELRLILMLLLFPVEWGGALLILALLGDFRRAVVGRSRVPADHKE